jgi:predicted phosphate transport protein (TIGR00153 family)
MNVFGKEKRVVELIVQFSEVIGNCASLGGQMLDAYLSGEVGKAKKLAGQTEQAEDEADDLVGQIREVLYSGAYLPSIREDIFRVVQALDKVANACETVGMHFSDQRPGIPQPFVAPFREVGRASFESVKPLQQAVQSYFNPEEKTGQVRAKIRETSHAESAVDDMEQKLTDAVFSSDLDLASKQHIRRTLHKIVRVSDRAEDASDELELTVLKSII